MYALMFFMSLAYVIIVFMVTRKIVRRIVARIEEDVIKARRDFQKLIDQTGDSYAEMKKLEEEAVQIFTLYDMTKEITRNFNEEEAFEMFKDKLSKKQASSLIPLA